MDNTNTKKNVDFLKYTENKYEFHDVLKKTDLESIDKKSFCFILAKAIDFDFTDKVKLLLESQDSFDKEALKFIDLFFNKSVFHLNIMQTILKKTNNEAFYHESLYYKNIIEYIIDNQYAFQLFSLLKEKNIDFNLIPNIKQSLLNIVRKIKSEHDKNKIVLLDIFVDIIKSLALSTEDFFYIKKYTLNELSSTFNHLSFSYFSEVRNVFSSLQEKYIFNLDDYLSTILQHNIKKKSQNNNLFNQNYEEAIDYIKQANQKKVLINTIDEIVAEKKRKFENVLKINEFEDEFSINLSVLLDYKDEEENNVLHKFLPYLHISTVLLSIDDFYPLLKQYNIYGEKPLDIVIERCDDLELELLEYVWNAYYPQDTAIINCLKDVNYIKKYFFEQDSFLDTYKKEKLKEKIDQRYFYNIKEIIETIFNKKSKTFELYSAELANKNFKHVVDVYQEFSKMYDWAKKIKETNGLKLLCTNDAIKANLEHLRHDFPNFSTYLDFIEENIYLNDMGEGAFYLPPSLLYSDPGIGKTFFFSKLAEYVQTPYNMINMESISSSFALIGGNQAWSEASPGIIFQQCFKSGYANNILILDELDKTTTGNYPIEPCLLTLLEQHTAKKFKDEFIVMPIDISKTIWVATANYLENISLPIRSRFNIFHIDPPNFQERKILAQSIYKVLLASNTWGKSYSDTLNDAVLDKLCEDENSSRNLKNNLLNALAKAAKRQDSKIILEDIKLKDNELAELWDRKQ